MPVRSESQRRAMYAAFHGKSTLGIPKSVAEKFVGKGHDEPPAKDMSKFDWTKIRDGLRALFKFVDEEEREPEHAEDAPRNIAASVIFIEPTGHILFAKRGPNEENWPDTWSLPGGKANDGEEPAACAAREAAEETGLDCAADSLREIETKDTPYGYRHTTFACPVDEKFKPKLNSEHSAYLWAPWDNPPQPLHPGVQATLDGLGDQLDDGDFAGDAKDDEEPDEDATFKKLEDELEAEDAGFQTDKTGMLRTSAGVGELLPVTTRHLEEQGELKAAQKHPGPAYNGNEAADRALGGYPVKELAEDGTTWRYSAPLLQAAARKARARGRGDIARRAETILAGDEVKHDPSKGAKDETDQPPRSNAVPPPLSTARKPPVTKIRERESDDEKLAADQAMAMDWRDTAALLEPATMAVLTLAFDRDSSRSYDVDGRLHVDRAHISKANVCPYWGKEIPDYQKLGLSADKQYKLLRDPEELKKAAGTFNNLPILSEHQPVSADEHDHDLVIGSTGTDATFDGTYLDNSLVFWPKAAINAIESNKQKQLSCAYRYSVDLTPGKTPDGQSYDGVMRNIVGNHVALVKEGRAGPDVVVGDSAMRAKDAETKHDPKNGQFTSGGSSGGGSVTNKKASHHLKQQNYHEREAAKSGPEGVRHATAAKAHAAAAEAHNVPLGKRNHREAARLSDKALKLSRSTQYGDSGESPPDKGDSAPVGDSKRGTKTMPTTAKLSPTAVYAMGTLGNYLAPRLAQDAKVDLKTILLGVTAKNIADRAGKIARDVKRACKNHLAQDADVDDVEEVIDAIQVMAPEIAQAASEPDQEDLNAVTENDDDARDSPEMLAKAMEFLKDKLSPEDLNAFTEMMGEENVVDPAEEAHDETEEERMEREKKEAEDMDAGSPRGGAMDAKAVKRAVRLAVDSALTVERERQSELRAAEKFVRPMVGDLGIACDSADQVYAHALEMRGISKEKVKAMHPSAYRPLLEAMQTSVPRQQRSSEPALASDAKAVGSFRERFPNAAKIKVMG